MDKPESTAPEHRAKVEEAIQFDCYRCGLSEKCHYFGKSPPFGRKQVALLDDCFVLKDPFSPRVAGKAHFLIIGGVCSKCQQNTCVECSLFYERRFCKACASSSMHLFPKDIHQRLAKRLNKSSQ